MHVEAQMILLLALVEFYVKFFSALPELIIPLLLYCKMRHAQTYSCVYPSDILVFLTGQEEIESAERILVKCSHHLPTGQCRQLVMSRLDYTCMHTLQAYCTMHRYTFQWKYVMMHAVLLLDCPKLIVCKLFAALPNSQQQKVFTPNPPVSTLMLP